MKAIDTLFPGPSAKKPRLEEDSEVEIAEVDIPKTHKSEIMMFMFISRV